MKKEAIRLTKEIEFDAAHRLSFHKGKCKNLHGHTWKVELDIFANLIENLILDFGDIKSIILDNFDHKVIIWEKDKLLLDFFTSAEELDAVRVPREPTAENLAIMITELIKNSLVEKYGKKLGSYAITTRLFESKTSSAEYYLEVTE